MIELLSYEELKKEAAEQGYRLVKIQHYFPLLKCICGCSKRNLDEWIDIGNSTYFYQCNNCGYKAPAAKTLKQAKENWNIAIMTIKNVKENNNG